MITDRELDAQLAGAHGIYDEDLPALPDDFLDHLIAGTDTEPASVIASRQLVADAHERRSRPGRRGTGRRTALRMGSALLAIAAAWTTAVLVAPTDRPATPDGTTTGPTEAITLVAADQATFPVTLEPAPAGLTPTFSMIGGEGYYGDLPLVYTADWFSGGPDRVLVNVFAADPRGDADSPYGFDEPPTGSATVAGAPAEVRSGNGDVELLWPRPDGRWVRILGEGAYGDLAALLAVAESVVDRPQPLGLQFGLAPAGWSLTGYEESRSIDLTEDGDPTQLLRLSVLPPGTASLDDIVSGPDVPEPSAPVAIQGRAGRLAMVDGGEIPDFWRAAGVLPDGSRFLLLAPGQLTQDQVVQIADQITYTG